MSDAVEVTAAVEAVVEMASGTNNNSSEKRKHHALNILVCSGNLGNAEPNTASMDAWLPQDGLIRHVLEDDDDDDDDNKTFDIIVIGMQEATFAAPSSRLALPNPKQIKSQLSHLKKTASQLATPHLNGKQQNSEDDNIVDDDEENEQVVKHSSPAPISEEQIEEPTLVHDDSWKSHEGNDDSVISAAAPTTTSANKKKIKKSVGTKIFESLDGITNLMVSRNHLSEPKYAEEIGNIVGLDYATKSLNAYIATKISPSHFKTVVNYQRGEMRLVVLVKQNVSVDHVTVLAENTGLASVLANKGGIVATVTIQQTRLSFLSCHLEAHEGAGHYAGRISNLAEILHGTRPSIFCDASLTSHYMFVNGDLNFRSRIEESSRDEINALIDTQDWAALHAMDELSDALQQGDCLHGFQEPIPPNFPPTFKVERQAGYSYLKNRTPSYTDRILCKAAHGMSTPQALAYEAIDTFETSDHKPIRAVFTVETNTPKTDPIDQSSTHGSSVQSHFSMMGWRNRGGSSHGGTGNSTGKNLHVFVSNIKSRIEMDNAINLSRRNVVRSNNAATNPYVTFVSDPACLIKGKRSRLRLLMEKVGFRCGYKVKNKENGSKLRFHNGWPRTRKLNLTSTPSWGDDEIHLTIKRPTTEIIVGSMLYLVLRDFDPNTPNDPVIGTVALNLAALAGTESSQETQETGMNHVDFTDEPLLYNGRVRGYISFSVFTWWLLDSLKGAQLSAMDDRNKTLRRRPHLEE